MRHQQHQHQQQHQHMMMSMRARAASAGPASAAAGPSSAANAANALSLDEFERFEKSLAAAPGMHPHPLPPEALAAMHPHVLAFLRGEDPTAAAAIASGRLPLPPHLPPHEQMRIRERATVVARHMHGAAGPVAGAAAADEQVARLMAGLRTGGEGADWEGLWQQRGGMVGPTMQHHHHPPPPPMMMMHRPPLGRPLSTGWADEFAVAQQQQQRQRQAAGPPATWADEFQQGQQPQQQHAQPPPASWAAEFEQQQQEQQQQQAPQANAPSTAATDGTAQEHAARLASVLARDGDPKMQRSQFLRFLSQVGRGELAVDEPGNRVVEVASGAARAAGAEPQLWADEFAQGAVGGGGGATQQQQQQQQQQQSAARPQQRDWADEFARGFSDLGIDAESREAAEAAFADDPALEAAWRAQLGAGGPPRGPPQQQEEQLETAWRQAAAADGNGNAAAAFAPPPPSAAAYTFAPLASNPFQNDTAAMQKGRDLFQRGLLSEAVLALEAEVAARPDDGAAWRLLGEAHAENDDDRQAIAALRRALEVDPTDAEALLALGVSHTNELDEGEAVSYLWRWLKAHPRHSAVAAEHEHAFLSRGADSSQAISAAAQALLAASRASPEDADPLLALGVVRHLSRDYPGAVAAFKAALELNPQHHSLWNKLGATLANHGHSRDASNAYRRALDLKPSYMRAWTNLGISFANVGDYEQAARHYVRALQLNPLATHVWGYLRTSLACAGRGDLAEAADREDLGVLAGALPLEGGGGGGGGGGAPGGMGQAAAFGAADLGLQEAAEEVWGANGGGS
jgi:peroxin-5